MYFLRSRKRLIHNLDAHEISAGLRGAIEISRVAEGALVKVFLEGVEDVLNAAVELYFQVFLKDKSVVEFEVEIHEVGSVLQLILSDVSVGEVCRNFRGIGGKVGHKHSAGIYS